MITRAAFTLVLALGLFVPSFIADAQQASKPSRIGILSGGVPGKLLQADQIIE